MEEAIEAITHNVFAAVANRQRYNHNGVQRLQNHIRQLRQHADIVVARDDLLVTSTDAKEMTAAQWAMLQEIVKLLPDATVTLRSHKLAWRRDTHTPTLTLCGALVTSRVGPFTLRRAVCTLVRVASGWSNAKKPNALSSALAAHVNFNLTRLGFFACRQAYGEHAILVLSRYLRCIHR